MQAWPRRAFTPHGSGFDPNEIGSSCFDPKAKFAQGRTDQSALGLPEGRQKPNDRLCAVAHCRRGYAASCPSPTVCSRVARQQQQLGAAAARQARPRGADASSNERPATKVAAHRQEAAAGAAAVLAAREGEARPPSGRATWPLPVCSRRRPASGGARHPADPAPPRLSSAAYGPLAQVLGHVV